MRLLIWTAAKPKEIDKSFGAALKALRPDVPPHKFIAYEEGAASPTIGDGEVLLVCGGRPLDVLKKEGVVQKNKSLTSLRDRPVKRQGGCFLVTLDPFAVTSEPEKLEVITWDVRLANRILKTGSALPPIGQYKWVNDYQPMIDWIEARYEKTGKAVDVATDTETMGFYPWYPDKDIVSISFTAKPETAEVLYLGPQKHPIELNGAPLFDQIKWLLTSPKVKLRLSNGKYDMIWIAEKWGIECTNFRFDNMLVGSMLNENRSNSLNMHAKTYTTMGGYDDSFDAKYDKGKFEEIPADNDYLTYAGGDTDAAQRVADKLRDELVQDPQLTLFYQKILHPAARAFEKVERRGVHVDQEKFAILREDLIKVMNESQKTALELLPQKMRIKYRERIDQQIQDGKSPLLPSILQEYFFSPNGLDLKATMFTPKPDKNGNPIPSTAKAHLRSFGDNPEAKAMVEALTSLDVASKTKSTFVDGFLAHLRPDGKLHPTYFLAKGDFDETDDDETGTTTGRLSAKNPPFQIIPKKTSWAKRIRECYPAPPGKLFFSLDYSQGELKVVACVANEKNMLKAYEQDLDMHAVTGASLGKVSYEEFVQWKESEDEKLSKLFDDLRTRAKAGNFGLLYGMGAGGFQAYAWANYQLKLTEAEAENIRKLFFESYPGLVDYHKMQKELVKLHEAVRSPLGRLRHLPTIKSWDQKMRAMAERQAINSPIQSCLSDMLLWAVALIEDAYPNGEIEIIGTVHDAMVGYVTEHDAPQWIGRMIEIMSNLPFHEVGWSPQLKFTADAELGQNLANIKKIKLAA